MKLHAFLTTPGFEDALAAEVGARGPTAGEPRWPGVVTVRRRVARPVDPAFALQQMPDATLVHGESVAALATTALDAGGGTRPAHVFVPDPARYRSIVARARDLQREARSEGRARNATPLVQWALVGRSSLLVSTATPLPLPAGGLDLAPWPAGRAPIARDRTPPSRAYRKLREALAWLGAAPVPDTTVVDLGASPGGWAATAAGMGARVVAVDRAPLEPSARDHPNVESVTGDAFAFRPRAPVDFLLCDVICDPARTLGLVERWMTKGWARAVVATLKFKGASYAAVADARARLGAAGWPFLRLKHLAHHHNEVAILARR